MRGSGMKHNVCDERGQHTVRQPWSRARQVRPSPAVSLQGCALGKSFSMGRLPMKRVGCDEINPMVEGEPLGHLLIGVLLLRRRQRSTYRFLGHHDGENVEQSVD